MPTEAFMQVRAALGAIDNSTVTDTNITGLPDLSGGAFGGVETFALIDRMIKDAFSRDTEFKQLVSRSPIVVGGITYYWVLQGDAGTSKAAFYADGGSGTPDPSLRKNCSVLAKALRSDYEVSGLLIAGGVIDVLDAEARDALTQMNLIEEQAFVNGNNATTGVTSSYLGLHQLLLNNSAHGDVSAIYGLVRGTDDELDVQAVDGGVSGTATGTLDLSDLDSCIAKVEQRKLNGRRVWLGSFERSEELNQLIQPQQRFVGGIAISAGAKVVTYRDIPFVRSKRMAHVGVTNTGSSDNDADSDNCVYLLDLEDIEFKNVAGVDQFHIPIMGGGDSVNYLQRGDVMGGYFKTYGVFVVKRFDNQCILWNLTAP